MTNKLVRHRQWLDEINENIPALAMSDEVKNVYYAHQYDLDMRITLHLIKKFGTKICDCEIKYFPYDDNCAVFEHENDKTWNKYRYNLFLQQLVIQITGNKTFYLKIILSFFLDFPNSKICLTNIEYELPKI